MAILILAINKLYRQLWSEIKVSLFYKLIISSFIRLIIILDKLIN